jgi:hypothetical protein
MTLRNKKKRMMWITSQSLVKKGAERKIFKKVNLNDN